MMPRPFLTCLALVLPAAFVWACGGGDLVLPSEGTGSVEIVGGNAQEGRAGEKLSVPLVVRLLDEAGQGVPDRVVVWVVASGLGSLEPATGTTDAAGFASTEWILGPAAGIQRAEAQVPGVGSVTFTATNLDDSGGPTATRLELVEGDGQIAEAGSELPTRPAVRVIDEEAQPVEGFEVVFVVTGGGGAVTGATQTTNSEGVARVGGWALGTTPGSNILEARAVSLTGSPIVFTAQATSADSEVDRLVYTVPPVDTREKQTFRVEVALADQDGNVVPLSGIVIYLALFEDGEDTPSNNRLQGDRFATTDLGVAVFDLQVKNQGRYRLRALTDDLPELGPHGPDPYLFSETFEVTQ